jgi:metallo-beta-lactamase family protein
MPLKVKFVGAVGVVTGSCHLLKNERSDSYYMIDCGIFQNVRGVKSLNLARGVSDLCGVQPKRIKAIFLTHAHMDHCGLIPRMYKLGFTGQVICTRITADFVKQALNDTVSNVDSFDKTLYDKNDIESIKFYCPDESDEFQLGYNYKVLDESDLFFGFSRTGHLAGAVAITFQMNISEGRRLTICFGGDLGPQVENINKNSSLLRPVQYPSQEIDYLVLESTYGGQPSRKVYDYQEKINALYKVMEPALSENRGKNPRVIIPAFTLGRTQDLIVDIAYLITRTDFVTKIGSRVPTVVVDSTLAQSYSNSYRKELDNWWNNKRKNEKKMRLLNRNHPLFEGSNLEVVNINNFLNQLFAGKGSRDVTHNSVIGSPFRLSYGREEVNDGPVIYISSSGMCSSGPVMQRLRNNLRRKDTTVLFVGYLPSSSDAFILKRAAASWTSSTEIGIQFSEGPTFYDSRYLDDFETSTSEVKSALIDYSAIYSGHADESCLCDYALRIDNPKYKDKYKPLNIFLVHGDDKPRAKLRSALMKYAESSQVGTSRVLNKVFTPTLGSSWFDLESSTWSENESNDPTWAECHKLLSEASDLQDEIALNWYNYKNSSDNILKQGEYLRKIDTLLDNLEEWRSRFRILTQKSLGTETNESAFNEESYDKREVYLDISSRTELIKASEVLKISGKVTRAQVRIAWTQLCREFHPDSMQNKSENEKSVAHENMIKINEAYALINKAFQNLI